jgi:hypothetical protein
MIINELYITYELYINYNKDVIHELYTTYPCDYVVWVFFNLDKRLC